MPPVAFMALRVSHSSPDRAGKTLRVDEPLSSGFGPVDHQCKGMAANDRQATAADSTSGSAGDPGLVRFQWSHIRSQEARKTGSVDPHAPAALRVEEFHGQ